MSGALQRCLEECLKLITLCVIGNRSPVVAVEIRPPPARTKIGALACYVKFKMAAKMGRHILLRASGTYVLDDKTIDSRK